MTWTEEFQHGITTALTTPVDENGSPDLPALESQIDRLYKAGIDGVLLLGNTGEGRFFSKEESEKIITVALKAATIRGLRTYICPNKEDYEETMELVDFAKGADYFLAYVPDGKDPVEFYKEFEKRGVKFVVYLPPGSRDTDMEEQLVTISRLEGFCGIKDSRHSEELFNKVIGQYPVLQGDDRDILTSMRKDVELPGGKRNLVGLVSGFSGVLPGTYLKLWKAFSRNDLEGAESIYGKIKARMKKAYDIAGGVENYIAAIKGILYLWGFCQPHLKDERKSELSEDQLRELGEAFPIH